MVRPVQHSLTSPQSAVKRVKHVPPASVPPRNGTPAIEPIKKVRVAEEVANRIQSLILSGTFKAGHALPAERVLSQRFGVSRGSVRDALRKLEMIGLLQSRHGQGTFPQELSVNNLVGPLASVLSYNRELQDELMDVRRMFEPAVARVAAARVTKEALAELEAILASQEEKVAANQSMLAEDAAFHAALARATQNRVVVRIMETLNDLLIDSRRAALRHPGRPRRSVQSHRAVLNALRSGDPEAAGRAMYDHIDQIAEIMHNLDETVAPQAESV